MSVATYRQVLADFLSAVQSSGADGAGPGALRVIGVSCREPNQAPATCASPIAIFSAILRQSALGGVMGVAGGRELLLFYLAPGGSGTVQITSTWFGIVQPDEVPIIFQTGGTVFDLGRVYVIKE